ncbi:MAG: hypothetical protein Q8L30_01730 [bacterium]|nr:hypothetical protein [bacterium]
MEKHPLHLKNPELQTSPEVQRAVLREEQKTGEKVPNDPAERLEAYLKRLEHLILDPKNGQEKKKMGDVEHTERPRALSLLREMVLNEYIRPNKEQMAQGAVRVEQRAARQMGIQADYNDETLEQRGEIAVGDLESSLDQWINYLSDPNEPYPVWFRYYAFRNILNIGEYDKDKQEFPKRSKGTFKLFPDVDRGALAYVEEVMTAAQDDVVLARVREAQNEFGTPQADMWTPQKAQAFVKMSFAKQYAEGIKSQGEITPKLRAETRGEWVHYHQNDDPEELWKSLQNKGTAWCTRGYPTAETQLKGGDFYVYYTLDATDKPTIPRIAIRMEGQDKIAEDPRGVFDSQQNLEPNMVDILDEKLKEFGPEAEMYAKKSEDMRMLTALEKKRENDDPFTKDDLVFLYEINSSIEGFGYQKDPRIDELRKDRNTEEDKLIIFECTKDQIAHVPSEINENTKAYVGQLEPGIFQKLLENLEHVYTSFPEKKIRRENVEIGGKSAEQLISEMEAAGINISDYAKSMLNNREFVPGKNPEEATLIRLTVADLGFKSSATTDQIYERAQILGLELCPADTGPNYRLKYQNQPLNEWIYMGMKQITDSDGYPDVFELERDVDGLWLRDDGARPDRGWNPDRRFVFRLRKSES